MEDIQELPYKDLYNSIQRPAWAIKAPPPKI